MICIQCRGDFSMLRSDNGIAPYEVTYARVCQQLGINPLLNQTIPNSVRSNRFALFFFFVARLNQSIKQTNETNKRKVCVDRNYALALEDITIANLTQTGIDFYWIDFQQGTIASRASITPMSTRVVRRQSWRLFGRQAKPDCKTKQTRHHCVAARIHHSF